MRYRTRVTAPATALLGTAVALATGPSAVAAGSENTSETAATPGAETVGDPVFPALGNGGYRVRSYHLAFSYDSDTRLVDATATLTVDTLQHLSRLSLDCLGLDIGAVRVNGRDAPYELVDEKLRITPQAPLTADRRAVIQVEYGADPAASLPHTGWVVTEDGFALAGQPNSAHTVFPCNDHPSDKALFSFEITVPDGLTGVANGLPTGVVRRAGRTTFAYRSRFPLATELAQITVGDYTIRYRQGPHGLGLRDVVPTARAEALEPALALTPGLMEWLEPRLGAFPFETYGLLPCNSDDANAFGFTGLETQTLTLYKPNFLLQKENLIGSHMMHELTHSWFGNMVSPATWADLWINEGHADYYGLLYRYERGWTDSLGYSTFEDRMKYTYGLGDQWRESSGPVAAPNATDLFDNQRYTGGVLVLYALRQTVGEDVFHRIERTFLDRHRGGSAATDDYIAVASELSGQDLSGFLKDWLYGTKTPRMPGHPDWTVTPVTKSSVPNSLTAEPREDRVRYGDEASGTL